MNSFEPTDDDLSGPGAFLGGGGIPLLAGLLAIAFTYALTASEISIGPLAAVAAIACLFAICCLIVNFRTIRRGGPEGSFVLQEPDERMEIEDRLIALDEANEFFGSSLNSADMFRLVSHRVSEIFPFAAAALLVPSDDRESLKFMHVDGTNSALIGGIVIPSDGGLAGRAFGSGAIAIDDRLVADRKSIGGERMSGFTASAALPLIYRDEPFAVFQLFTSEPIDDGEDTLKLLEAITEHVTPIFRRSLAFERSLSNALTDPLTGLPNERAFYMVLESQLAESIRHREDRPLTILSIDIRDFGAVNSMLGHGVGDRMLEFVGTLIGGQLRKMDFLARTINDEFIVILPTANETVALEIIGRIRQSFERNEFEISDGEGVVVALNVGWASFWKDGETAEQLIMAAHQRKREAKSELPVGVLWFPREYVN